MNKDSINSVELCTFTRSHNKKSLRTQMKGCLMFSWISCLKTLKYTSPLIPLHIHLHANSHSHFHPPLLPPDPGGEPPSHRLPPPVQFPSSSSHTSTSTPRHLALAPSIRYFLGHLLISDHCREKNEFK